mmetsp:Transcript_151966/g.487798  ORF Transcript_151966/g.487798 Transcript_151966/m.487798 type:complete len:816 (-) Transcript_151966:1164-3611(-)
MWLPSTERKQHLRLGTAEGHHRILANLELSHRLADGAERLESNWPNPALAHAAGVVDGDDDLVLPLGRLRAPQPDLVTPVVRRDERNNPSHGDPLASAVVSLQATLHRRLQDGAQLLAEHRGEWRGGAFQLAPQQSNVVLRSLAAANVDLFKGCRGLARIFASALPQRRQVACRGMHDVLAAAGLRQVTHVNIPVCGGICQLLLHHRRHLIGIHLLHLHLVEGLCRLLLLLLVLLHRPRLSLFLLLTLFLRDAECLVWRAGHVSALAKCLRTILGVRDVQTLLRASLLLLAGRRRIVVVRAAQEVHLLQVPLGGLLGRRGLRLRRRRGLASCTRLVGALAGHLGIRVLLVVGVRHAALLSTCGLVAAALLLLRRVLEGGGGAAGAAEHPLVRRRLRRGIRACGLRRRVALRRLLLLGLLLACALCRHRFGLSRLLLDIRSVVLWLLLRSVVARNLLRLVLFAVLALLIWHVGRSRRVAILLDLHVGPIELVVFLVALAVFVVLSIEVEVEVAEILVLLLALFALALILALFVLLDVHVELAILLRVELCCLGFSLLFLLLVALLIVVVAFRTLLFLVVLFVPALVLGLPLLVVFLLLLVCSRLICLPLAFGSVCLDVLLRAFLFFFFVLAILAIVLLIVLLLIAVPQLLVELASGVEINIPLLSVQLVFTLLLLLVLLAVVVVVLRRGLSLGVQVEADLPGRVLLLILRHLRFLLLVALLLVLRALELGVVLDLVCDVLDAVALAHARAALPLRVAAFAVAVDLFRLRAKTVFEQEDDKQQQVNRDLERRDARLQATDHDRLPKEQGLAEEQSQW